MITIHEFEKLFNENQYIERIIDHTTGNRFEWLYEDDKGAVYGDSEDAMQGLVYLPLPDAEHNATSDSTVMGFSETNHAIELTVESAPLEFPTLEYADEYTRIYTYRGKYWAAWDGDTYVRLIHKDISLSELIEYLKD